MSAKFGFLPEVDALRALAVILTLGAHFLPETGSYHIPYLWYGVDLFFVISGFLITSILFKSKEEAKENSGFKIVKNFYIRRALRLFPIYYLFILFFFLSKHFLNLYLWKDEYNPYFFTYFQNWYFFKIGALNSQFSHLWSLGVEEQFYIIWPFVILFIPNKILKYVFWGLIFISISLNAIFFEIPVFRNLTFSNFHTLGMGALLAYYYCITPKNKGYQWVIVNRFWLSIVSLFVFLTSKIAFNEFFPTVFISELFLAITAMLFVLNSVIGWPQLLKPLVFNRIVQHIGKVSYGIYLFHLPLPALIATLAVKLDISTPIPENPILKFFIYFIITVLLATLSYQLIEKRILRLKAKFD